MQSYKFPRSAWHPISILLALASLHVHAEPKASLSNSSDSDHSSSIDWGLGGCSNSERANEQINRQSSDLLKIKVISASSLPVSFSNASIFEPDFKDHTPLSKRKTLATSLTVTRSAQGSSLGSAAKVSLLRNPLGFSSSAPSISATPNPPRLFASSARPSNVAQPRSTSTLPPTYPSSSLKSPNSKSSVQGTPTALFTKPTSRVVSASRKSSSKTSKTLPRSSQPAKSTTPAASMYRFAAGSSLPQPSRSHNSPRTSDRTPTKSARATSLKGSNLPPTAFVIPPRHRVTPVHATVTLQLNHTKQTLSPSAQLTSLKIWPTQTSSNPRLKMSASVEYAHHTSLTRSSLRHLPTSVYLVPPPGASQGLSSVRSLSAHPSLRSGTGLTPASTRTVVSMTVQPNPSTHTSVNLSRPAQGTAHRTRTLVPSSRSTSAHYNTASRAIVPLPAHLLQVESCGLP
ncbi:hypothetical protein CROQUDRAFT_673017 [Cronartium quercuum f. sp. fusiforme G11]|uniref:Uncharacterized protein n=1 Tax=Cronartium quercuum f. sp. fusiforme G11 TaxID=708437 RepID=A0A9P6NB42_9BASI|nr:hypothetical protein CROQUDRAFT_673017 [Cronartium quercuum f. sp. fusiforme G11]